MSKPAALQADFTSYRPVPSRKVLQLTFEVPLETQESTFRVLGYPTPGESTWVAIARLALSAAKAEGATAPNTEAEKPTRHFRDMPRSQQAALKCEGDMDFRYWLTGRSVPVERLTAEVADEHLKVRLGIISKRELDSNPEKGEAWQRLLTSFEYRDRT